MSTTIPTQSPVIAIIGGGIAGLTLAIALYKRNIPVIVYEQASHFGEIGAGVAFTGNAIDSMKICDHGVYEAFEKVVTRNLWPEKQLTWFDFVDGMDQEAIGHVDALFSVTTRVGINGVHRAKYLEELIKLVPPEIAQFRKHVDDVKELPSGRLQLIFRDGTTAEADAVIGCDGIKSTVRQIVVKDYKLTHTGAGERSYTHKYAYRGLIDMPEAIKAIGEERASNASVWMGPHRHVLTYPVNHGETLNVVAFVTKSDDWPDYSKSTLPAHRDEAIQDFQGFGPNVMNLLSLVKDDLDIWSIFDLRDGALPVFNKGRIALSGDAAHATTPHHGAGAGMCIENSAIMSSLLSHPSITSHFGPNAPKDEGSANLHKALAAAFEAFTKVRKERTQWLVEHARRQGDLCEMRLPEVGLDWAAIEREITMANAYIENVDVEQMCRDAVAVMDSLL